MLDSCNSYVLYFNEKFKCQPGHLDEVFYVVLRSAIYELRESNPRAYTAFVSEDFVGRLLAGYNGWNLLPLEQAAIIIAVNDAHQMIDDEMKGDREWMADFTRRKWESIGAMLSECADDEYASATGGVA
jgi:hypothetical protein